MRSPAASSGSPADTLRLRDGPRPDDAGAVRAIVAATGAFSGEELAIAVELVHEALERGAASGYHFLFASREDALLGYTCFGPIPGTRSSFDLYWIAVDPSHQRAGIGRWLLAESEARVRALGGTRLYADTSGRPDYARARAFYAAQGFRLDALLEDFYAPGDAKAIFVKPLCASAGSGRP